MKIAITVCSREKAEDEELLPAKERYLGSHIALAREAAKKQNARFFILSANYGLIGEEEKIPYYDHLLVPTEVPLLARKVRRQLHGLAATVVVLFTKPKSTWDTYKDAVRIATVRLNIPLVLDYEVLKE